MHPQVNAPVWKFLDGGSDQSADGLEMASGNDRIAPRTWNIRLLLSTFPVYVSSFMCVFGDYDAINVGYFQKYGSIWHPRSTTAMSIGRFLSVLPMERIGCWPCENHSFYKRYSTCFTRWEGLVTREEPFYNPFIPRARNLVIEASAVV